MKFGHSGPRPGLGTWHYVNIPIDQSQRTLPYYDRERDCPGNNCIVARLNMFAAGLGDKSLPPRQRLEALKFVVHFVADIHQPLHCADNNDRGGNSIHVEFAGHRTNLHAVWDTEIIAQSVIKDERSFALQIVHGITAEELSAWSTGSAEDWANESYQIARDKIYGLPSQSTGQLPDGYEKAALPIVNQQLAKAGVRLAMLLNDVLR